MQFLRNLFNKIIWALLFSVALALLPAVAFSTHITNPETVKGWLSNTDAYQNIVKQLPVLIASKSDNQATKTLGDQIDGNPLLDLDRFKQRLAAEVDPADLQTGSETIIDSLYAWLQTETTTPQFSVRFDSLAPAVRKAFKQELSAQLSSLPPCSDEQLNGFSSNPDIYDVSCQIPGLNLNQEINKALRDVAGPNSALNEPLRDEDLDLSIFNLRAGPIAYDLVSSFVTLYVIFIAGLGLIYVFSADIWQKALKRLGKSLFTSGGIFLIFFVIASNLTGIGGQFINTQEASQVQSEAAIKIIEPVVVEILNEIGGTGIGYSIILMLIGGLIWYLGRLFVRELQLQEAIVHENNILKGDQAPDSMDKLVLSVKSKPKKSTRSKSEKSAAPDTKKFIDGVRKSKK